MSKYRSANRGHPRERARYSLRLRVAPATLHIRPGQWGGFMAREEARTELAQRHGGPRDRLWSDFSYVASSSYREKVLRSLAERPKLPKQLSQDTGLRIVHVSRALRELSDRSLTECLTPETKRRGPLSAITPTGPAPLSASRSPPPS